MIDHSENMQCALIIQHPAFLLAQSAKMNNVSIQSSVKWNMPALRPASSLWHQICMESWYMAVLVLYRMYRQWTIAFPLDFNSMHNNRQKGQSHQYIYICLICMKEASKRHAEAIDDRTKVFLLLDLPIIGKEYTFFHFISVSHHLLSDVHCCALWKRAEEFLCSARKDVCTWGMVSALVIRTAFCQSHDTDEINDLCANRNEAKRWRSKQAELFLHAFTQRSSFQVDRNRALRLRGDIYRWNSYIHV